MDKVARLATKTTCKMMKTQMKTVANHAIKQMNTRVLMMLNQVMEDDINDLLDVSCDDHQV